MNNLLVALLVLASCLLSTKSMAQTANKKKPTTMIELPIKLRFVVDKERCEYSDYVAEQVYVECSYSMGGVPPKSGQIIFPEDGLASSGVTGDLYFEDEGIYVSGGVVSVRFIERAWADDGDGGMDGNKFYEDVEKYFSENVVTFEFLYIGPDFEFDEKMVGQAVP